MCGIVAGVSTGRIMPVLLEGLRRLEYRGYDSCGVAVIEDGRIQEEGTQQELLAADGEFAKLYKVQMR